MTKRICTIIVVLFSVSVLGCRDKGVEPNGNEIQNGSIIIDSEPQGARIYINGLRRSIFTPDTLKGLFPGIYQIGLRLGSQYRDTAFVVYLQEGKQLNYSITMRTNNY